jgi:hypothetical protein
MKKSILNTAMILCVLAGISGSARADDAAQWTCTDPQWVGAPRMMSGNFEGTQQGLCTIQLTREGSIALLDQHFLESVKTSKTIHSGPTDETYQGLPGVLYDVTVQFTDGANVTVRENIHIASDRMTRLVYAALSTSVAASGMAGYLRKLDVIIDITKGTTLGKYEVKLTNSITVARPWYAPGGVFFGKAKEIAVAQFLKFRAGTLPELVQHL